jgi:hypothetical protein
MNRGLALRSTFAALALFSPAAARAADCEAILSSQQPYVMRGTSIAISGTVTRSTVMDFRVTRGDQTTIAVTAEPQTEAGIEFVYEGVWLVQTTLLTSKEVTRYEYSSRDGTMTPGTEMRYTRVLKKNGEVTSAETGLMHIGEAGPRTVGDCMVDVVEIKGEVKSDKLPVRVISSFYAPKLGITVKTDQGGMGPKGDIMTSFVAASLELAH